MGILIYFIAFIDDAFILMYYTFIFVFGVINLLKYLIFDRGDTIIYDLPEDYGGMDNWPYYKLVDGVFETLPILVNYYTCFLASNTSVSSASSIRNILRKLNIEMFFKEIYTQADLMCSKPNVDFFLNLLRQISALPSEACYIGNDYALDIVPAKKAGLFTVLLTQEDNNFTCADFSINNFNQLPKVLTKLKKY